MGYWRGQLQISFEKETFYLRGLPWLNWDGIKMKFSVQSIMGKSCEPDNLASEAHPGTRSDRLQLLWVSRLKGTTESPLDYSIFMISLLTFLTDIRLTSIIWSYIDMFHKKVKQIATFSCILLHCNTVTCHVSWFLSVLRWTFLLLHKHVYHSSCYLH